MKQAALKQTALKQTALKQIAFEWNEVLEIEESSKVQLDRETSEAVIALMTRLLIALVRETEEVRDER